MVRAGAGWWLQRRKWFLSLSLSDTGNEILAPLQRRRRLFTENYGGDEFAPLFGIPLASTQTLFSRSKKKERRTQPPRHRHVAKQVFGNIVSSRFVPSPLPCPSFLPRLTFPRPRFATADRPPTTSPRPHPHPSSSFLPTMHSRFRSFFRPTSSDAFGLDYGHLRLEALIPRPNERKTKENQEGPSFSLSPSSAH